MAYKRIIAKYKKTKDDYKTSWYIMGEHDINEYKMGKLNENALIYSATLTAIADFVYTFNNSFSKDEVAEYIKVCSKKINNIINGESSDKETIKFYEVYLSILNKFKNVTEKDVEKIVSFLESERKSEKEDKYDKMQKAKVSEIIDLAVDIKRKTRPENTVFHVATDPEEIKAYLNKNNTMYNLILQAIEDGLDSETHTDSIHTNSKRMKDIKKDEVFSDLDSKDFEIYRKTFNSVSALTKQNKKRLKRKLKINMLEKDQ